MYYYINSTTPKKRKLFIFVGKWTILESIFHYVGILYYVILFPGEPLVCINPNSLVLQLGNHRLWKILIWARFTMPGSSQCILQHGIQLTFIFFPQYTVVCFSFACSFLIMLERKDTSKFNSSVSNAEAEERKQVQNKLVPMIRILTTFQMFILTITLVISLR